MDKTDKLILEILQKDSKINNQELADKVSLSPSPCLRRVKQLEKDGFIDRYVALLNPEKIGLQLTIIVSVGLDSHDQKVMSNFEKVIQTFPEVIQCDLIAGQAQDYMLKVIVPSLDEYHQFLINKLTQTKGVKTVHSSFVLRKIVDHSALSLDYL
ncbi:Lrp/AsnC family transcriptional regulator [Thiotrichales bacterium 19S11-10]|nr:Lrp/AsnC family transcriptional regulator [Thiotrichales bacterium 19S11-10]MCF6808505.1 Lrp/AsnC family transcriptional regulator [Thiotrichales bacterium 19S9-11]MCF6812475.1 Lrp/AsnC family transcriptional regulator [Thiotrichales bacterium 19S9-12]